MIFERQDGNYWTSYHGHMKGLENEITLIDPIEFKYGKIYTNTPTYTPQRVEYTTAEREKNLRKNGVVK